MKKTTDTDVGLISEEDKLIRFSFSARRCVMMIGKGVVRALDNPAYICFRVNKEWNSLIVFPCNSKIVMSFKVPRELLTGHNRQFRISSKSFINELATKNGLDIDTNYMVPGTLIKEKNLVLFNIADAYAHSYLTRPPVY